MRVIKYLAIIFVVVSLFLIGCSKDNAYDAFAQCLTEKGVTMYGAFWCPHCKAQKAMFGDSWQFVTYVECSLSDGKGQTEFCRQMDIEGYPTWEFSDGSRQSGEVSFDQLSEKSGCILPLES